MAGDDKILEAVLSTYDPPLSLSAALRSTLLEMLDEQPDGVEGFLATCQAASQGQKTPETCEFTKSPEESGERRPCALFWLKSDKLRQQDPPDLPLIDGKTPAGDGPRWLQWGLPLFAIGPADWWALAAVQTKYPNATIELMEIPPEQALPAGLAVAKDEAPPAEDTNDPVWRKVFDYRWHAFTHHEMPIEQFISQLASASVVATLQNNALDGTEADFAEVGGTLDSAKEEFSHSRLEFPQRLESLPDEATDILQVLRAIWLYGTDPFDDVAALLAMQRILTCNGAELQCEILCNSSPAARLLARGCGAYCQRKTFCWKAVEIVGDTLARTTGYNPWRSTGPPISDDIREALEKEQAARKEMWSNFYSEMEQQDNARQPAVDGSSDAKVTNARQLVTEAALWLCVKRLSGQLQQQRGEAKRLDLEVQQLRVQVEELKQLWEAPRRDEQQTAPDGISFEPARSTRAHATDFE